MVIGILTEHVATVTSRFSAENRIISFSNLEYEYLLNEKNKLLHYSFFEIYKSYGRKH